MGQDHAGATRWSATSRRRAPQRVLDVACGPAAVTCALARAPRRDRRDRPEPRHARRGRARTSRAGARDRVALVLGRGEQLPFADGTFDALTFTYLLRYVADPAATLAELARVVQTGRCDRQPRVRRAAQPVLARLVVGLHAARAPRRRALVTGGRAWFDVGRFLGPEHLGALPSLPRGLDARRLARAGIERRRASAHEPRRRPRHLGTRRDAPRCATAAAPGPPSTRARPRRAGARLVDAAAPAVHGVAPRLRRHRGVPASPRVSVSTPGRDAAGVLPRRRRRRPRARRAARPAAAHRDPRSRPSSAAAVASARRARRHRRRRRRAVGPGWSPFIVVGPSLVVGVQPRAVRRRAAHRRRLRPVVGRVPRPHRVRRPAREARRRRGVPPRRSAS